MRLPTKHGRKDQQCLVGLAFATTISADALERHRVAKASPLSVFIGIRRAGSTAIHQDGSYHEPTSKGHLS